MLIFLNLTAAAQLVNVESQRIHSDSVRQSGEFNFDYSFSNVNSKSISVFNSSLSLQKKSTDLKTTWLVLGSAEISKAKGEDFENSSFFHLRYSHKLKDRIRWEAFNQVQANLPIGLKFRYLAGTGPRFRVIYSSTFNLYLGSVYMYEYDELRDSVEPARHVGRSSSYLSLAVSIPAIRANLTSTTYYQPRFADLHDFRVLTENRLEFNITKRLKSQSTFRYFYDSRPARGYNNYTTAFDQGFGWTIF
jgi:hypothetical protein